MPKKKKKTDVKCLYVYNKIDQVTIEHVNVLARQQHTAVISCIPQLGTDALLRAVWRYLGLGKSYIYISQLYIMCS
jgi:ribosome-interacting GTPase 1